MIKYLLILVFIILKCFTLDNCFFWDGIAGWSMPANYLLQHGFFSFVYPPEYVAEPPLAHLYLAMLWSLFGRNLLVAHVAIAVFSVGVIWQTYNLSKRIGGGYTPFLFLLILLDPTLVTQLFILSPDVIMLFWALLSINLMLDNRRKLLSVSLLCLGLVSIRGFVTCAGLGLGYLLISYFLHKRALKDSFLYVFLPFIPVLLAIGAWFAWRKIVTGYFLYQPGFAYMDHRQWVDGVTFIKNTFAFAWRMIDSGRWIVFLFFFVAIVKNGLGKSLHILMKSPLCMIYVGILLLMMCVTIPVTNPFGNRYFMILFVLFALITMQLLIEIYSTRRITMITVIIVMVLCSSHFWVYPEKMSQAWDSTLAHLPYYSLRRDMIHYLEEQQIDIQDVSASFPMLRSFADTEANQDERCFSDAEIKDSKYVLYSNVFNWSDEDIDEIYLHWKPQKEFKRGTVFLRLYVPVN
ncbi:glycosyltransferase family 39 protein [Parabacteroides sp. AM08-6]|uniref:ArnT family glycosyltransferase n=1 Tax=Parabacteroides sp. AM08-6 TaxID=2292053 RepID=UPI000EFEF30E|nr:hypothetical protein [Parabacteroides sp. AM08-6]RHJ84385.1 hypothetical protein DW103_06010 [Parabacteroides sp. AM08-6]